MKKHFLRFMKPVVEYFPKLATTYRVARDNWKASEEPQRTPMNFMLAGNELMQNGEFELEETRIVNQILPHVDVVINVGANIGYYCCIALIQKKYVVAFEPMNANITYLLKNVRANKWDSQIEVYPNALSDKVGIIEIFGGGTGASLVKGWAGISDKYVTLVPATTLDIVLGDRFQGKKCLIIVDIEGSENLMLAGASSIIKMEPKPFWLIEISVSEHQPQDVAINPNLSSTFQTFWDCGYEAWTTGSECRIIYPDEIEEIVKSGEDTLNTHNFLFIEKGKMFDFLMLDGILHAKSVEDLNPLGVGN